MLALKSASFAIPVGSLSAGARTVLWSGNGLRTLEIANEAKLGLTLERTVGGRVLTAAADKLAARYGETKAVEIMMPIWRSASAIFAMNAKGTVNVCLSGYAKYDGIFNTIEAPIIRRAGLRIIYHFVT